jgi:hypothetical protein
MQLVGLGDLAAAARAMMAVAETRRGPLLLRLLDEADLGDRHRRTCGRSHPVFGNGTLMSARSPVRRGIRRDRVTWSISPALPRRSKVCSTGASAGPAEGHWKPATLSLSLA